MVFGPLATSNNTKQILVLLIWRPPLRSMQDRHALSVPASVDGHKNDWKQPQYSAVMGPSDYLFGIEKDVRERAKMTDKHIPNLKTSTK
jgi:hypothetical protein